MSRLKYLKLLFNKDISISSRLFNGTVWQLFFSVSLPGLKHFSLKLPMKERSEDEIKKCVGTFQTSWWLNTKEWFIEYHPEENALVTVRDYLPKILDNFDLFSFDMKHLSERFLFKYYRIENEFDRIESSRSIFHMERWR